MFLKYISVITGLTFLLCGCGADNTAIEANIVESKPRLTYSLEDVAKHAQGSDCWLVIDGAVYDVTKFIPKHPGGAAILAGCGKDATELFHTKDGREKDHSSRADSLMKDYYIGELVD